MFEQDKKERAYLSLSDLYHELNSSVNYLLIIREFLRDVLNIKEDKETVYEFSSVLKYKHKS